MKQALMHAISDYSVPDSYTPWGKTIGECTLAAVPMTICLAELARKDRAHMISVTSESAVLRPDTRIPGIVEMSTSALQGRLSCVLDLFRASSGETDRHWKQRQGTFANSFTPGSI